MFTHHIVYSLIPIILVLPCIIILVYWICYRAGNIRIHINFSKPRKTSGREDQQKQKLMNYKPDVEDNVEYGSLSSSINEWKSKSTSSNELTTSNPDYEQLSNSSKQDLLKFDQSRVSSDSDVSSDEHNNERRPSKRNCGSFRDSLSLPEYSTIFENKKRELPSFQWPRRSSDLSERRNSSQKSITSNQHNSAEYVKKYSDAQSASLDILLSTNEANWVRIKDPVKDTIQFIEVNGKKTYHLKAIVDASPDVISRIVFDKIEEIQYWSPKLTMHCTLLKKIDNNTHIVHSVISPGKWIKARDFVVLNHRTKMNILQKESIVLSSISIDYDCPYLQSQQKFAYLRGSSGPSCIVIYSTSRDNDRSELRWILNGDLGGWEPKKIGDLAFQIFLVRYIDALRERIKTQKGKL